MKQQLKWDEEINSTLLVTKNDDGSILSEPLTPEEAAQWTAEHQF